MHKYLIVLLISVQTLILAQEIDFNYPRIYPSMEDSQFYHDLDLSEVNKWEKEGDYSKADSLYESMDSTLYLNYVIAERRALRDNPFLWTSERAESLYESLKRGLKEATDLSAFVPLTITFSINETSSIFSLSGNEWVSSLNQIKGDIVVGELHPSQSGFYFLVSGFNSLELSPSKGYKSMIIHLTKLEGPIFEQADGRYELAFICLDSDLLDEEVLLKMRYDETMYDLSKKVVYGLE